MKADTGTTARRKLPIGIQTFREIREGGYYYVDKTPYLNKLVHGGKHYFLSRPRRFGKSLLVDTLKELFEGSEDLFRGLAIHGRWDWSTHYPVLRLDFSSGSYSSTELLREEVLAQLDDLAAAAGIRGRHDSAPARMRHLVEALHRQAGQRVAVLVDEYDKPILDALQSPDIARANRDFLRGLYGTVKFSDAHIRFTLLTGVSKFSKVNLFSGLNNLLDITLDPEFSAVCGYTEADLDTVFAPELRVLDREQVRDWYNGYNWLGDERVYNPFDVLLLLRRRAFGAYWFETGTPTFLVDTLVERGVASFDLDGMLADDALLSSFEVGDIEPEALLFQTGYLTIRESEWKAGRTFYRLAYPNQEVRQSLNQVLLTRLVGGGGQRAGQFELYDRLMANDFAGMEAQFRALFAGIPSEWHTRNEIARYEGYYASVFYACLAALGLDLRVEDSSAAGRLDLAMLCNGRVYLFEFKVAERASEGAALAQLRARGYAEKYRGRSEPIHLIGVEFSEETRNIAAFETEAA